MANPSSIAMTKKVELRTPKVAVLLADLDLDLTQAGLPVTICHYKSHCIIHFIEVDATSEYYVKTKDLHRIQLMVTIVDDFFHIHQHDNSQKSGLVSISGYGRQLRTLFQEIAFCNCFSIKGVVIFD